MDVPKDIMSRYLSRRESDLHECEHCLADKNYHQLERVGHQLKGNGVTFGHPELSKLGKELEEAAASGDEEALRHIIGDFSKWVNHHQD